MRKMVQIGAVALVVLLLGVLVFGIVRGAIPLELPTRVIGPPICEGLDSKGRQFKADTRNVSLTGIIESSEGRGVVYRRVANTDSDFDVVGRLLPANCQVGFVGFCIGEALPDLTSTVAPLDQQWFMLPDHRGYVHGGVVQEMPPGTIGQEPQTCTGGREEPTAISLVDAPPTRLDKKADLRVQAPNAATVAAAISTVGTDGKIAWHPLGIDMKASDGFTLSVTTTGLAPQEDAVLLLVVCWAGNVPGRAMTHLVVDLDTGGLSRPTSPSPDFRRGASVACKQTAGGS